MEPVSAYILCLKIGVSAMISLWVVSVARRDSSLVDLWWAPGFAVATLVTWLVTGAPLEGRPLLALALVLAWSGRMTWLIRGRRRAHPGEDPRYGDLRRAWDPGFWWKSLFIVFLLQAALQWAIALASMATVAAPGAIGPLAGLGGLAALGGLALETVADAELDAHRRRAPGALCTGGLRAVVRFPNYLGEIVFWTGLWLIAVEAGAWWTALSPALLALLLAKVSGAPILDERFATRAGFEAWRARTPAFLPRPLLDLAARARARLARSGAQ